MMEVHCVCTIYFYSDPRLLSTVPSTSELVVYANALFGHSWNSFMISGRRQSKIKKNRHFKRSYASPRLVSKTNRPFSRSFDILLNGVSWILKFEQYFVWKSSRNVRCSALPITAWVFIIMCKILPPMNLTGCSKEDAKLMQNNSYNSCSLDTWMAWMVWEGSRSPAWSKFRTSAHTTPRSCSHRGADDQTSPNYNQGNIFPMTVWTSIILWDICSSQFR